MAFTPALTGNRLNAAQNPATFIAQDLRNDHPISITYDTTKDTKFMPALNGKVGVLALYGAAKNQVEWGTCHNVHDAAINDQLNRNRLFG